MSPRLVLSPSIFEAHPPCLVVGWTSSYLLYSTLSSGWNMTGQVPPETGGFTRFKASGVAVSLVQSFKKHLLHQLYSGFKRTNIQGASCKSPRGSPDVSNVPQPCPVSPFHPETYRINITPSSTWLISLLILPVTLAIDRPRPIYISYWPTYGCWPNLSRFRYASICSDQMSRESRMKETTIQSI